MFMHVASAEHNLGFGKGSVGSVWERSSPSIKYAQCYPELTAGKEVGCRWIGAYLRVVRHLERVIRVIGQRLISTWSIITSMSE